MKNYLFIITVLLFALSACAAQENNSDDMRDVVNDKASEEYVICSAYYSVVSGELKSSGKHKPAEEADDAMEDSFSVALELARLYSTEEMANKVTWSRFQSNLEEMEKTAGKDYSNISTLRASHGDRCKKIMTSPEEFMKEKASEMKNKANKSK